VPLSLHEIHCMYRPSPAFMPRSPLACSFFQLHALMHMGAVNADANRCARVCVCVCVCVCVSTMTS
jgi:hypothetical protein